MNQTRTIRLPIHVVKELNIYLRTARELSQRLDHEPTPEEIALELDRPVDDVTKMLRLNERISSVDTPIGGDGDKALLDILPDSHNADPEFSTQDDDIRESLLNWLDELNPKQKKCLRVALGFLAMNHRPWKKWVVRSISLVSVFAKSKWKVYVVCVRFW